MAESLTKEYFDEQFVKLATEVAGMKQTMATKDDLHNTEARLKDHAEDLQEELAGMIERKVNVTARVSKLEGDVAAIKEALHI